VGLSTGESTALTLRWHHSRLRDSRIRGAIIDAMRAIDGLLAGCACASKHIEAARTT